MAHRVAGKYYPLTTQQDWLEVLTYSNQLHGITILRQSFELDFLRMTFSKDDNLATIEVAESYERTYEGATQPALGSGIVHKLNLRQNGKTWEIVSDVIVNGTDSPPTTFDKVKLMEEIKRKAEARRTVLFSENSPTLTQPPLSDWRASRGRTLEGGRCAGFSPAHRDNSRRLAASVARGA